MAHRTIRTEHCVDDRIQSLGIEFRLFDEMMEYINGLLCSHPETFPVIPGTRISICKTNEFIGNSFRAIPALAIYFHYDETEVWIVSIEPNSMDSYAL